MKRIFFSIALMVCLTQTAFASDQHSQILLAQSSNTDYRVSVLEEQVRQLTGRIEDLNFQILEMQELIRRMREDNEYRFEQLEEKQGSLSTNEETQTADSDGFTRLEKPEPSDQIAAPAGSGGATPVNTAETRKIEGVEIYDGEPGLDTNLSGTLGTIQFDANGNIVGSGLGKPLDLTAGIAGTATDHDIPASPEELFGFGYDRVQTGHYEEAELALTQFSETFPNHPRLPEARFWLGETYLGRGLYDKAAETYLDAHKRWPNGKFGPQSLLKLGVAVAGLNQRELACATFAEVLQKYPQASRVIRKNVTYEQRAAKCLLN